MIENILDQRFWAYNIGYYVLANAYIVRNKLISICKRHFVPKQVHKSKSYIEKLGR